MKRFIFLFAALFWAVSAPALPPPIQPNQATTNAVPPYGQVYSMNKSQNFLVPVSIASNTAMLYNLVTNALSGSTIYLSSGSFDLNTPLIIPDSVSISGQGSNATILINLVRGDGAITGRGCGIVPGNHCTVQYLQITNALAHTNYQGCIGAITPQPIFTDLTTRGLFCRGSSDGYQINQDTAFNCVWNDYFCNVTSKWDTAVFICNDFGSPATMTFHSYGSTFTSVGPAATGANTAHGIYAQADFVDILLDGVAINIAGNSVNRAWQLDTGLEEGDTAGVFAIRNTSISGSTVNAGSIVPTTNTALLSLDSSPRNGASLTNIPGSGLQNPLVVTGGTSNYFGGVNNMATNVGEIFTTTNAIVLGTRYIAPSRAFITASFTLNGAVAGTAIVTLYIEGTVTNKLSISAGPLASLIVADTLSGMVGPSEVYYFANESSGSGATVAFVANTFSRKLW